MIVTTSHISDLKENGQVNEETPEVERKVGIVGRGGKGSPRENESTKVDRVTRLLRTQTNGGDGSKVSK